MIATLKQWRPRTVVSDTTAAPNPHALQGLSDLFGGEFLEGLDIERSPEFNLWLTAQRSRYAAFRVELLRRLVERLPSDSDQGLAALEKWAEIAPFDDSARVQLLKRLAGRGRIDTCNRWIAAAEQLYKAESLDFAPIRRA